MAGGIDWFRWHHGSVTDPKFQLVAKRAGTNLPAVLAVWTYMLEKASAADFRGCFGEVDAEAVDCLFGLDDGTTEAILAAMVDRKLIADEYIVAWDKRQPKRERPEDVTAAERKRNQRERDAAKDSHVTPSHATSHQEKPRGEERREEESTPSLLAQAPAPQTPGGPQLALVDSPKPRAKTVPDCPHQAILALWAEVLPALPQHNPEMWTGARADHLRARWRETAASKGWETEPDGLAYLRKLFGYIGQSAFLTGRAKPVNGKPPFIAELAWIVSPQNWAKVHEGKYHTEAA